MEKQENSHSCFVCGVKNPYGLQLSFYQAAPGEVQSQYTVAEQFQGYPGVVHGGIVAAMLDEAAGRAFMVTGTTRFMFTAKLSVRYRKPVPVGRLLTLKGHAYEDKGRVTIGRSEIYDENGTLLADAEAVLTEIPDGFFENQNAASLGWKVYSDREAEG